jgi:hypothetical protein
VTNPQQQITITHNGSDYILDTLSFDVVLTENAASICEISVDDNKSKNFLAKCDLTDNLKVEFRYADETSSWTQLFGGWIADLEPSLSQTGELLKVTGICYGQALINMNVKQQYGNQSANPTLNTIKEVLTDTSLGIIPKYVNKVMASTTDSGYSINTTKVADLSSDFKYLAFPCKPAIRCLEDMIDLIRAANIPNAGAHFIIVPSGTTPYLCLATVGNHENPPSDVWPTYWNTTQTASTLEVGDKNVLSTFKKKRSEANYVLYCGALRKPGSGDWAENNAASWASDIIGFSGDCTITNDGPYTSTLTSDAASGQKVVNVSDASSFSVNDLVYLKDNLGGNESHIIDSITVNALTMVNNLVATYHVADNAQVVEDNVRLGNYSIKSYCDDIGESVNAYYPSSKNLNLNVTAIGSQNSIPSIDFDIRLDENCDRVNHLQISLWKWTDATHHGYFYRDISNVVSAVDKYFSVSLPIGPYYKRAKNWDGIEWATGFLGANLGDWSKIDLILLDCWATVGTHARMWIDGLSVNGQIIRVAYDSSKYASQKCKMRFIKDDVPKDDSLVASDDTGEMAQFAKAELYRAVTEPTTGQIVILMKPTMKAGQLVHMHFGEYSTGNFRIDKNMRITTVRHHLGKDGAFSYLDLTDDVLNSRAVGPSDAYAAIMKAVAPGFQDRARSSLITGDMDVTLPILAKEYST